MLQLHKIESTTKKRKRVGRGGSRGGTSGRGHKGQKSRSGVGGELKPFFEGGQMPLSRRLPHRGFSNSFKKNFTVIGLNDLESHFESGETVNKESLFKKRLIKGKGVKLVKVLANGSLKKSLTVHVEACSQKAVEAIKQAGGTVELIKEAGRDSTAS